MNHEAKKVPIRFENGTEGEMTLQFPVKEKERVFIVGCATSKDMVPWDDKNAEFWGVNNLYGVPLKGAHYDRWFEIHNIWQAPDGKLIRRGLTEFRGQPVMEYLQGLSKLGCTIYMQKHWPNLIPLSVPYPLNDVINFFSGRGFDTNISRYLTNTISYEIVLAIVLGFKEIQVWGVDMAVGTEYEHQRPSCEFWLGVAAGMGIKISIPNEADLLKTRFLYGFEERQQDAFKAKIEKLRVTTKMKRLQIQNNLREEEAAVQQAIGAENAMGEIIKIWSNHADDLMFQPRGTL